ncbi:nickel-type superoxide dismutase maturation protease [Streptomyces sp. NBC_00006]|uniref:nickel-type superoxide dismutase maturation protease n=1 Tax=unclassified Streptomyces TaxID=2593676 RepID=UPI0022528554|nr:MULTISPECIES: nickel-type superoxide dismutase maturation protease [unclassified Streptomyces]MCX4829281.1 nickel-type superoxide dismutase maturation protease [Streptomyces sp. NBC_01016]MCX5531369.1 nickel-type superoxide dismutase maturation protease [Streptomyces sp. NBC_00006]
MPEAIEEMREAKVPFQIIEVEGPSMVPTLYPGDWMLVQHGARVRAGDVIVLRHPFQQDLLVVKRIAERREGGWWVRGDNPGAGGDSTVYGVVPDELVLAKVRGRLRRRRPWVEGEGQRSVTAVLSWVFSAVRPVLADRSGRSASKRLRAR